VENQDKPLARKIVASRENIAQGLWSGKKKWGFDNTSSATVAAMQRHDKMLRFQGSFTPVRPMSGLH
jgi:hypothetical protein